ncbi:MAG: hypothetical protein KC964_14480 [Candidatus Omnitrophica bacterium]|nr:hypothetical protein [Candidatus Omnitrophota bacterium]
MAKTAENESKESWREDLETLCDGLIGDKIVYFPIRHHSPACALHLSRLIEEKKPAAILVEGPKSLSHYIEDLGKPDLVAPVALFSQYVDRKGHTLSTEGKAERPEAPPPRFSAYYPLCDYSPELVAIREGHRVGAKVAFCDLDYAKQVIVEHRSEENDSGQTISLFDERHLARSRYLIELAKRTGCRDTNELWDRLFESAFCHEDTEDFVRKVATYCFFARVNTDEEDLRSDGTLARESHMWKCIESARKRLRRQKEDRPLLVVTGGFHTPPFVLKQVKAKSEKEPGSRIDDKDILHAIIPYSFEHLDALNGYAAGMPSPNYYQRIWETAMSSAQADLEEVSRSFLVELPQRTREAKLAQPLSTADAIAAHQQACHLARFRGNPGPMREDMLDGIRGSFVKGSLDAEGAIVFSLACRMLCGDAIGRLPEGTRTHPLIEDFRDRAAQVGLKLETSETRSKALSIYEKKKHRQVSGFFHSLQFLGVPFARFTAGPDFVSGANLSLRIEHWDYAWSPHTDSALIELTPKGTTIQEAVLTILHERQAEIEKGGAAEGSRDAVELLLVCCRLGLHEHARRFSPFVHERIRQDGILEDSVQATARLDQLHHFRSPLENERLEELPHILQAAYSRSCYLLISLANLPEERVTGALSSLATLRELVSGNENEDLLDAELLWQSADSVNKRSGLEPSLAGGVFGILFSGGKRTREDLIAAIEGWRLSRDAKGNALGRYLFGLFALCRELTWNDHSLMERITESIASWPEEEFYRSLPDLRLAFAQHTPQETDRVGKLIARIGSIDSIGDWYNREVDEEFVSQCVRVATRAVESLKEDCLETF